LLFILPEKDEIDIYHGTKLQIVREGHTHCCKRKGEEDGFENLENYMK
jgi:hypothetical protein